MLRATDRYNEAKAWLFNLTDFLLLLYRQGYEPLPLGGELGQIFNVIFRDKDAPIDRHSYLIPLVFKFAIMLDAKEVFETFRSKINPRLRLYELGMPRKTTNQKSMVKRCLTLYIAMCRFHLLGSMLKRIRESFEIQMTGIRHLFIAGLMYWSW